MTPAEVREMYDRSWDSDQLPRSALLLLYEELMRHACRCGHWMREHNMSYDIHYCTVSAPLCPCHPHVDHTCECDGFRPVGE